MNPTTTPCREWQGPRDKDGYGIRSGRKRFGTDVVHRQIMVMAGHDIEGKVVMHLCDNPPCFRYDHLRIGSHADNVADRVAKGRTQRGPRTPIKHGTYAGYQAHMRRGILVCDLCRAAVREYRRGRARNHGNPTTR